MSITKITHPSRDNTNNKHSSQIPKRMSIRLIEIMKVQDENTSRNPSLLIKHSTEDSNTTITEHVNNTKSLYKEKPLYPSFIEII
ncbi:MAG TPA: hypothetical protein VJU85_02680 [Nitrososphaeraceae archaeon]|nr:hypothetical protein [Nitrososphaeraceae archaeon]